MTRTGKWHYYRHRWVSVCVSDGLGVQPDGETVPDGQHVASDKDCKSCRRIVDRSVG